MISPSHPKIVIAVVTFNRLDVIQKCWSSWTSQNLPLWICDNSHSGSEAYSWLQEQAKIGAMTPILGHPSASLSESRNSLIMSAMFEGFDFVLLLDSDVEIKDGSIRKMFVGMINPRVGMVGFSQANHGKFPISPEGYVEELANECLLTRVAMWKEIGLYPECQQYYSADSWKSTIANMHGWRTVALPGSGYAHYAHSSQENPGVKESMAEDIARWQKKDAMFEAYWRMRLAHGKGVITNFEDCNLPRERGKM